MSGPSYRTRKRNYFNGIQAETKPIKNQSTMFDFLKKIRPFKLLKKWVFKHTVPEIIESLEIKVETVGQGRNKVILVKVEVFGIQLIEKSFQV